MSLLIIATAAAGVTVILMLALAETVARWATNS